MENQKKELMQKQMRINMRMGAISLIIGLVSLSNVVKHSQIRNVDVVALLGCGMCMGVFMINTVRTLKMKLLNR